MLERRDPIVKAALADFGEPGAIIPFQAPLSHTLIADNKKKKGTFEKLFLDGRPPVNVGVTSGGDVFGGSSVTFSDVLGDQQFNLYAASISQYRTLSFSYLNLARRFNYALQAFSQTTFFYGNLQNVLYDGSLIVDRDLAQATRTRPWRHGLRHLAVQPLPARRALRRVHAVSRAIQRPEPAERSPTSTSRTSSDDSCSAAATSCRSASTSSRRPRCSVSSARWPAGRCGSGTSTRQRWATDTLSRQTMDADVRYYQRLGGSGLLALRARGFKQLGRGVGLHVLRRQLRNARLRVSGVHRRSRRAS